MNAATAASLERYTKIVTLNFDMFPFTITYKKSIHKTTEQNRQKVMDKLVDLVQTNHAKVRYVDKTQLTFTVSIFGNKWDKFSLIDKGIFTLTDNTFSFKFSMYGLFVITALMSWYASYLTTQIWVGIFFFSILGLGNWIVALVKYKHLTDDICIIINKVLTADKTSANICLPK